MASKQQMDMNKHIRSRSNQPIETPSRMKRERKRENARKAQQNGSTNSQSNATSAK